MRKANLTSYALAVCFFLFSWGTALSPQQIKEMPTPRQILEKIQKTLPLFFYTAIQSKVVLSDTDPSKKLRRIEVEFVSQIIEGIKMEHRGEIYFPANPEIYQRFERLGKFVIVTYAWATKPFVFEEGVCVKQSFFI